VSPDQLELVLVPRTIRFKPQQVIACTLLASIVAFYTITALWFPMVYIWSTYEDLLGEWAQFWSLAIAMVVSCRLAMRRTHFRWFFGLLAASCFYVAMEEISWGQRLLGFSSPEFFKTNNLQGETNLHNFLTGPYATTLKVALTYVMAGAMTAYGVLYPLALRWRFRLARWVNDRGVAPPPLYLSPFFLVAAVLECAPFRFNEAEVAELLVGIALALMVIHYQFARTVQPDTREVEKLPPGTSKRLAYRIVITISLILSLATATTTAVYATPSGRARIERRLENGIRKFAGRYERYGCWKTAAGLYVRLYAGTPRSVSVVRGLATCYSRLGDEVRFQRYIKKAIELDLSRLKKGPRSASANRSLARTYRLTGESSYAEKYLRSALRIGLRRVTEKPNNAADAYSLGKTYSMLGRHGDALVQFSRACQLNRASKKYRKAYFAAKKQMQ